MDDVMKPFSLLLLFGLAVLLGADSSPACDQCGNKAAAVRCELCGYKCCPCELCPRSVLVPCRVTETRMKVKIVETMKEREETYTVFECVPKKRTYSKECCYLETEVKSKDVVNETCRRVNLDVTLEDQIKIPVTELVERTCQREVCTECGKVCIEEPCTCTVTRTQDMPRVQNCSRPSVVFEKCGKTIDYCVKTPKFDKQECGVETVYELVPVEKTRKVQVCVPEAVRVPCDVQVVRKVAKDVICCEHCWKKMRGHKHHDKGMLDFLKKDK
jgi:hypothetical protein